MGMPQDASPAGHQSGFVWSAARSGAWREEFPNPSKAQMLGLSTVPWEAHRLANANLEEKPRALRGELPVAAIAAARILEGLQHGSN